MANKPQVFVEKRYEVAAGNSTYYVIDQGGGSWHVGVRNKFQNWGTFTDSFMLPDGIPLKAAIKMLWKIARGQYTTKK